MNKNISTIVKRGLCNGCGTCVGICPKEANKIIINKEKGIYIPKIDEKICIECGTCFKVCPGHEVNFKLLNSEIFGKTPENFFLGNSSNCYIGHSNDNNIRFNSSSGGLVTEILIFALENGIINGALVTKMDKDNPLQPEPFIARTRKDVEDAARSKYCPVPANIALKYILKSDKEDKFAVVGLPCHLHGIRKAELLNNELKKKIVLHIGIFCNHTPNFWGTNILLKRLEIQKESINEFVYRGFGWPGKMKISTKDNLLILPDYYGFIGNSGFFIPDRCSMCNDSVNELSDISLGDPWSLSENKIGESIIISRNKIGNNLLEDMELKNRVKLRNISYSKVIQSQRVILYFKKINIIARNKLYKFIPNYKIGNKSPDPDKVDYILAYFSHFTSHLYSKPIFRSILRMIPDRFISIYKMPYNIIISLKARRYFKK